MTVKKRSYAWTSYIPIQGNEVDSGNQNRPENIFVDFKAPKNYSDGARLRNLNEIEGIFLENNIDRYKLQAQKLLKTKEIIVLINKTFIIYKLQDHGVYLSIARKGEVFWQKGAWVPLSKNHDKKMTELLDLFSLDESKIWKSSSSLAKFKYYLRRSK